MIDRKKIVRTSFVPVTRDDKNDVYLLGIPRPAGCELVQAVKDRSTNPPALRIDGKEVVLLEAAAGTSERP